jgi:hypothetical protein
MKIKHLLAGIAGDGPVAELDIGELPEKIYAQ